MKKHGCLFLLALGTLSLAPMARGERAATQPSSGAWTQSDRDRYKSGAREVVHGNVLSVDDSKSEDPERGVHVTLSTDKGELKVNVGPRWFLTQNSLALTHGEPITVVGIRISFEGKPELLASEVEQGQKRVVLREDTGKPRWLAGESSEPVVCRNVDDALLILNRNCTACHLAPDHTGALFLNKARLSEPGTRKLIIQLIETGQMPPAHAKFRETADGKALLAWLKQEPRKKTK